MKTQSYRNINRDDLGDVPKESWTFVDKLLEIMNSEFEELSDLAQKGASFQDNFNCQIVRLDVKQDTEVQVTLDLRGKAVDAILTGPAGDYARLRWRTIDQNHVAFAVKFDTAFTGMRPVRVIFFGE